MNTLAGHIETTTGLTLNISTANTNRAAKNAPPALRPGRETAESQPQTGLIQNPKPYQYLTQYQTLLMKDAIVTLACIVPSKLRKASYWAHQPTWKPG